jgi:hemoglobin-like flavoprotein
MTETHQQHLIRSTFREVDRISQVFALTFYQRLFELDPQLRSLFHNDIEEQSRKLMQFLRQLVESVDHPEDIVPALESLGRRHATYGVREEHYETVGAALLWAFAQVLGAGFTAEARAAWERLYVRVAEIMKRAVRINPVPNYEPS